jgi:hypothetical protein
MVRKELQARWQRIAFRLLLANAERKIIRFVLGLRAK